MTTYQLKYETKKFIKELPTTQIEKQIRAIGDLYFFMFKDEPKASDQLTSILRTLKRELAKRETKKFIKELPTTQIEKQKTQIKKDYVMGMGISQLKEIVRKMKANKSSAICIYCDVQETENEGQVWNDVSINKERTFRYYKVA